MKLVLGEEGQPVHTLLLIFTKFGLYRNRDIIFCDFATVKELCQEISLGFTFLEQFFRKAWWIR
jgi:hypothetical protein